MKPKYNLVLIGRDRFVMLNATDVFRNFQAVSTIFPDKADSNLDVDIFEYFGLGRPLVISSNLDLRTVRAKKLIKSYGWFCAGYLPEISKRAKNSIYADTVGSYHLNKPILEL